MSMKDEVLELKKELEEVKEQSFASEILQDYKLLSIAEEIALKKSKLKVILLSEYSFIYP